MTERFVKLFAVENITKAELPLPPDGRGWPAGAQPLQLRDLPYPFANFVSISNDCDSTTHKFDEVEAAFSFIRETLGLPISDSYFAELVCTGRAGQQGLRARRPPLSPFDMTAERLKELSAEYFRKHHQGWFDTIHGFVVAISIKVPQNIKMPLWKRLMHSVRNPWPVVNRRTDLGLGTLRPAGLVAGRNRPARFRFIFPDDWRTPRAPRYLIMQYSAARGPLTVQIYLRFGGKLKATLTGAPNSASVPVCTPQLYIVDLWKHLDVEFASLHDLEVEVRPEHAVDIYSIFLVNHVAADFERMRRLLGIYNISASAFTSHGLGPVISPGFARTREAANTLRLADLPENPHYIIDVLRNHGVKFINSYTNTSVYTPVHIDSLAFINLLSDGTPFYDFQRHSYVPRKADTRLDHDYWRRNGRTLNHSLCDALGERIFGLLSDIGDKRASGGLVYTHLYAWNNPEVGEDPSHFARPFNQQTRRALIELANRYYDPAGAVTMKDRIFVAPVSSLVRLSTVKTQIGNYGYYDPSSNEVHLSSWHDPVLQEVVPDRMNAWRELRALTFYVRDSHTARVFIDGEEAPYLIRNPADETGRESVTFADASAPALLLGRLDPTVTRLAIDVRGATLLHGNARSGLSGIELTLEQPQARLTMMPKGVSAANYHAVLVETVRSNPDLRFSLTFAFGSGLTLTFGEQGLGPADTGFLRPWTSTSPRMTILPFYALLQGQRASADIGEMGIGIGSIDSIILDLTGTPGDHFSLRHLAVLRDSETKRDPDGLILGGHVPEPERILRVCMRYNDLIYDTRPTSKGFYFFERKLAPGTIVEVWAEHRNGMEIEPLIGRYVEVATNRTDIDFEPVPAEPASPA